MHFFIFLIQLLFSSQCSNLNVCPYQKAYSAKYKRCVYKCSKDQNYFFVNNTCSLCQSKIQKDQCVDVCSSDFIDVSNICVPRKCFLFDIASSRCVSNCQKCLFIFNQSSTLTCRNYCDGFELEIEQNKWCLDKCPQDYVIQLNRCVPKQGFTGWKLYITVIIIGSIFLIIAFKVIIAFRLCRLIGERFQMPITNVNPVNDNRIYQVNNIIKKIISKQKKDGQKPIGQQCSICLQDDGSNVYQCEQCGNTNHIECLSKYLAKNPGQAQCPLCRANY